VYFHIWKYAHLQMKDTNKMGENQKKWGMVLTIGGDVENYFQGPGTISKYGKMYICK